MSVESFLAPRDLQVKTGREYSACIIQHDQSQVTEINRFLRRNPQKIPKILHQIWIGPNKPPWKWINSFRKLFRDKFPGWKYYLWNDREVSKLNLTNRWEYCSEKTYHGKSDILRYELLDKYGGIYIDADSEWLGLNLGELIDKTNYTGFFVAKEGRTSKDGLANGVIGTSKNNPIIRYVVGRVSKHYFGCKNHLPSPPPAYTTGPYLLDQVLYKFNVTIFPYYYFYPIYWLNKESLETSIEYQKQRFPNSYMTQYGYTSNGLGKKQPSKLTN